MSHRVSFMSAIKDYVLPEFAKDTNSTNVRLSNIRKILIASEESDEDNYFFHKKGGKYWCNPTQQQRIHDHFRAIISRLGYIPLWYNEGLNNDADDGLNNASEKLKADEELEADNKSMEIQCESPQNDVINQYDNHNNNMNMTPPSNQRKRMIPPPPFNSPPRKRMRIDAPNEISIPSQRIELVESEFMENNNSENEDRG